MEASPTRWEKAKRDWRGFGLRRALRGTAGTLAGIVALLFLGFRGAALENVIVVGAAVIVAALVAPLGELAWCWLQAPIRLVRDDVQAIEGRVDDLELKLRVPQSAAARPAVNVRLSLLAQITKGSEISTLAAYGGGTDSWTKNVLDLLAAYGKPGDAELFLQATDSTGPEGLKDRLDFLRELAKEYE